MSVKIMGKVWDLDLPHSEMLVLLAMADHADHEGNRVFPSMGLVAWKTGYEERQVRRIVASLVEHRILREEKAVRGLVKVFSIHLEAGRMKPAYQATRAQDTPDKMSDLPRIECPIPPDKMSYPPRTF